MSYRWNLYGWEWYWSLRLENSKLDCFHETFNKTKEKFNQDLETHFEGEYEVDFADDWVDQLVMGVTRPIGFKGERSIQVAIGTKAINYQLPLKLNANWTLIAKAK